MRSAFVLATLASSLVSANLLNLSEKTAGGCSVMCKPIMELTQACGSDTNCVCNNESFDVQTVGGACVSCLQQSNMPNDSLNKLSAACQFEAISYAPQMTALAQDVQVDAKMTAPMAAASTTSGSMTSMSSGMTMTVTMSGMTMTTTMSPSTGISMSGAERMSQKGGMKAVAAIASSALLGFVCALLWT